MTLQTKRLSKELKDLSTSPPGGLKLLKADDFNQWFIQLEGAPDTLYKNQKFLLRFKFNSNYPLEAPEVVFVDRDWLGNQWQIPIHNHVYSNGHICMSLLYDSGSGGGYSPALTVASLSLSLLSMLSSSTKLSKPPDNDMYIITAKPSPKQTTWAFHDDTV